MTDTLPDQDGIQFLLFCLAIVMLIYPIGSLVQMYRERKERQRIKEILSTESGNGD